MGCAHQRLNLQQEVHECFFVSGNGYLAVSPPLACPRRGIGACTRNNDKSHGKDDNEPSASSSNSVTVSLPIRVTKAYQGVPRLCERRPASGSGEYRPLLGRHAAPLS